MDQREAEQFIERWKDAYNSDKRRFVDDFYSDDVEIQVAGMFTLRGKDEVWSTLGPLYEGPVTVQMTTIHRVVAAGTTIVVELETQIGEQTHEACSVIDVEHGRVVRDHSYAAIAGEVLGVG